jgi:hypothetical protein
VVRQAHHERFDRLTTNGPSAFPFAPSLSRGERVVRQAHHERFDRLTTNGFPSAFPFALSLSKGERVVRQAHHVRFDRLTTNGFAYPGARNTAASGGTVSTADAGRPCHGTGFASTPPRFPAPPPPYARASEFRSSRQRPPAGSPTR